LLEIIMLCGGFGELILRLLVFNE